VTEQANDAVLTVLQEKLQEHLENLRDNIAMNGCKSYPDYTHQTGIIKGLVVAEDLLLQLDRSLTEE